MILKHETVGFVRGGALYLEPPQNWRKWQRDVWTCCPPHKAEIALLRNALREVSTQTGRIIFISEKAPMTNAEHLRVWEAVKKFADDALKRPI